jgi:hypothetical protein
MVIGGGTAKAEPLHRAAKRHPAKNKGRTDSVWTTRRRLLKHGSVVLFEPIALNIGIEMRMIINNDTWHIQRRRRCQTKSENYSQLSGGHACFVRPGAVLLLLGKE